MEIQDEKAKPLTVEQRGALIERVEDFKNVLFSKDGKAGMVRRKNEAWMTITNNVNALRPVGHAMRTVEQVKKCWENISSKGRKEISKKKKDAKATGGGPPMEGITEEEDKLLNIYGNNNPIFTGEPAGFDSLVPPANAVSVLDLSSEDVLPSQQQSYNVPFQTPTAQKSIDSSSIRKFVKRKWPEEECSEFPRQMTKEQLTIDVLKSELDKNKAEKQKYMAEIELIKELKTAATSKKAYYDSLATKIQLETALLAGNSNIQIIQAEGIEATNFDVEAIKIERTVARNSNAEIYQCAEVTVGDSQCC